MENTHLPLLSVIVPVYNTEKYVENCLESIFQQSYPNIEIIVVNDASEGNIEEIIQQYNTVYSNIRLVSHSKNEGLFRARITGVENSSGEYIAFVDSDDSITVDYYRKMINQAETTHSDMVASDFLYQYEDGTYGYPNQNLHQIDIDLHDTEIINTLMEQHGLDFMWHVVWNKIYSRALWDRCYPYLNKQTEHLIMCEDVLYSVAFYTFARHFTNVHHDYYLYFQTASSSTGGSTTEKKYLKYFADIQLVFSFVLCFLQNFFLDNRFDESVNAWRLLILKSWGSTIESKISKKVILKRLCKRLEEINGNKKIEFNMSSDTFFYKHLVKGNYLSLNDIKMAIADPLCKYVSFDIFDTLIVRPFLEPTDLFYFLEIYLNKSGRSTSDLDFYNIRIEAEKVARKRKKLEQPSCQDISLKEIYDEIRYSTLIPSNILQETYAKEEALETKFCVIRNIGKELLDFSLACGKTVICVSDMYLSGDVIRNILDKNGYSGISKIYVSNEVNLTKTTGDLFRYVLKDMKIKASEIIHIGDNWHSDVEMPQKAHWKAFHLPKTTELFMGSNPGIYSGGAYSSIFVHPQGAIGNNMALSYLGIRCMLAVVANKIFDNPFVFFNKDSDFNANPYFIGYFILGMHMFAISEWLIDSNEKEQYEHLHFIARDGCLPRKAFEILNKVYQQKIDIQYIYLSRKAIFPLLMQSPDDYYGLTKLINIFSHSPEKLLRLFENMLTEDQKENAQRIVEEQGVPYFANFHSLYEFEKFGEIFVKNFYNKDKFKKYKEKLGEYFSSFFCGKSATFDVGYSVRIESALVSNFQYDVTPYYIHLNGDTSLKRCEKYSMQVKTLYPYSPAVTGVVREHMISELAPSCIGYVYEGDQVKPMFEKYNVDYQTKFVTTVMQSAALDFVKDMVQIFGQDIRHLPFRYMDACLPMEFFLHYSREMDRDVFGASYFEDDLGEGKSKIRIVEFWNTQTASLKHTIGSGTVYYSYAPKWKKAVMLAMFDRKTLKQKVKTRYEKHPILLKFMKSCYTVPRKIYQIFKQ